MKNIVAACFAFLALFSTSAARAQEEQDMPQDFVLSNSIFVLFHEIGHLLIGELGIPILGKEEDAADNLATLLLISAETVDTDTALTDSATGWFWSDADTDNEYFEDADFYDVHSLDIQRAFHITCLAVGADPDVFAEFAEGVGIDSERQESCTDDFAQMAESWNTVLEPHVSSEDSLPAIEIIYEPSETYKDMADFLKLAEFLELGPRFILNNYTLPRPVTLRATECGEANAFYDPEIGEVHFCYEMVDHFFTLFETSSTK